MRSDGKLSFSVPASRDFWYNSMIPSIISVGTCREATYLCGGGERTCHKASAMSHVIRRGWVLLSRTRGAAGSYRVPVVCEKRDHVLN